MSILINSLFIIVSVALAGALAYRLQQLLHRFRIDRSHKLPSEMPSVSICIPARNETHAMTQCLERVLASDYPKMEVVVFDDESADDTSILIKSFAHAGVRFIPGSNLPDDWLGKNFALETLAREASGTYVLFMDVDTHIRTTTISQLVAYMTGEDLQMVSVIPGRNDTWRPSVLFGHLRYFWEIVLSRESSPATASAFWMINRHTLLNTLGGFRSHKAEVEPEEHLAAIIGTKAYHCLVNDTDLGVSYEKRWQSQVETSRRLLYPMVGGTWYYALFASIALLFLNLPTVLVISGLFIGWSVLHTAALVAGVLFSLVYGRYTLALWRSNWWTGMLLWPVVALQEFILLVSSVVGYARHTITWKGRVVISPKIAKQLEIVETN